MAKAVKTSEKRQKSINNLKPGNNGMTKPFTSENQPSSDAKKRGWKEFRAERHLTQAIIKEMLGDDGKPTKSFKEYITSLVDNAKLGNAKAIEAINKFIEDDVQKIDVTSGGQPIGKQDIILSNGESINLE